MRMFCISILMLLRQIVRWGSLVAGQVAALVLLAVQTAPALEVTKDGRGRTDREPTQQAGHFVYGVLLVGVVDLFGQREADVPSLLSV